MTIPDKIDTHKGVLAWFARNPVAANLLMLVIVFVGMGSALNIQRALQPDFEIDVISITVPYPGATPIEVENGIVLKVEEALKDVDEIEKLESTASDSVARIVADIHDDYDPLVVMDKIKSAVDAIATLPEEAERPIVKHLEFKRHVMNVSLSGNLDEYGMKGLAEQVKQEMLQDKDISSVEIHGARDYEISIEIPEHQLLKYQLSVSDVANAVKQSSLDVPGGSIKTENGDILLRTRGQARQQYEFENIVLISYPDGTRLTLGDIATIKDGFTESDGFAYFDKRNSLTLEIFGVGSQDLITVSDAVNRYVDKKKASLPDGIHIDSWADATFYLHGRLDMMMSNLGMGALLVFITLALFLNMKLAFWVMVGLPVCFLGTFAVLSGVGASLNMLSMFGFILVLGIVVDDAIIIGESAFSEAELTGYNEDSVIRGALRVATPATFGVLTTIVAFAPTMFTQGVFAPFPEAVGWVVIACLFFSLVESKWILPAHLAHSKPGTGPLWDKLNRLPARTNEILSNFITNTYRPFLLKAIAQRYKTAAIFTAMLIVTGGLVASGVVRFVMMPEVPGDFLKAELEMMEGTPDYQTRRAYDQLSQALTDIDEEYHQQHKATDGRLIKHQMAFSDGNRHVVMMLELTKTERRDIDGAEIARRWRERLGAVPGVKNLAISIADDGMGPALAVKLSSNNQDELIGAAKTLQVAMRRYQGVYDVRNGASSQQDQIVLEVKPSAELLGLSSAQLGRQVRDAFYGAEAQRFQRGNEEVKVMVRFPRSEREDNADLENMYIISPTGDFIPLSNVADVQVEPGYTELSRVNGERALVVTAQVDKHVAEPSKVLKDVLASTASTFASQFPSVKVQLSGESEESETMMSSLMIGFALALFGIFGLLAIPLKSYTQPMIIMGVIPFGIIGAVFGHIVLGMSFSMLSFFGVIALSGVVVNDSLIMVDFVNSARARGESLLNAVVDSGCLRFRAILLTSLTTFLGLLPMLLETSIQAQFVIPMAVSLGFGIIFATVITLILIPCAYIILDDLAKLRFGKNTTGAAEPLEQS
ncbi:efflux RND transporter permease subunit [Spongiibacter sp. KMU-158]|uniref:Efflux RND transporter permease subunit n=1 Tax=Spongiibacter pelagi TaxID=2760804 RepID=A0A927C4K1_9GAMM|nr:efflux RND transporter permease subunit [Spongiibacter pelagi]MBD2859767.1 efflux RND transporter permease subunit [Spongiibacter pelagi]